MRLRVRRGFCSWIKRERSDQFGSFSHLVTQQGDQVEAGGSAGLSSPFGEGCVGLAPLSPEGLKRGEEQGTQIYVALDPAIRNRRRRGDSPTPLGPVAPDPD